MSHHHISQHNSLMLPYLSKPMSDLLCWFFLWTFIAIYPDLYMFIWRRLTLKYCILALHLSKNHWRSSLGMIISYACNRQCSSPIRGSTTHFDLRCSMRSSIQIMNSITDEAAPCLMPENVWNISDIYPYMSAYKLSTSPCVWLLQI